MTEEGVKEGPKHKSEKLKDLLAFSRGMETYFSTFLTKIVDPLKKYVKSQKPEIKSSRVAPKTIYEQDPMVWCVFSEFETLVTLFQQISKEIEDNIAPNVVDGPFGKWTNTLPKTIQIYLKIFHAYFVYYLEFLDMREAQPKFNAFLQEREKDYGKSIDDYFKEYMRYLEFLNHTMTTFNTDILSTKNDQNQIQGMIEQIREAQNEAQASLNDSVPEKFGPYDLEPSSIEKEYGTLCVATIPNKEEKYYALIISKTSPRTLEFLKQIEGMIDATLKLVHPNIIPVENYIEDDLYWCIVFPFTENMLLTDILQRTGPLPEEAARTIFRQMMHAIQHVHSNGIIHNHITPSNFMIYQGKLRLFDFSYCHFARPGEKKGIIPPPLSYACPDSLREKEFDGAAADIWAAGVILYEMLNGKKLFSGSEAHIKTRVMRASFTYPKQFSPSVISLLKGILTPVSLDRLTSEQILSHPWMKKTLEITIKHILEATPPSSASTSPQATSRSLPSSRPSAAVSSSPSRVSGMIPRSPPRNHK